MTDFKRTFDEARDRLIAELHRTRDEPRFEPKPDVFERKPDAFEPRPDRFEPRPDRFEPKPDAFEPDPGWKSDLAKARVERFADTGLDSLRRLSADLLERATELDREVARLSELAKDAAAALREPPASTPPAPSLAPPAPSLPPPAPAPPPASPVGFDPIQLPPILPSLSPASPLDRLEEQRRSIAESPVDFPPRKRRFEEAEQAPVVVRPGVRVVVEQMRLAGESDDVILGHLTGMGVDDPEAVLAEVQVP